MMTAVSSLSSFTAELSDINDDNDPFINNNILLSLPDSMTKKSEYYDNKKQIQSLTTTKTNARLLSLKLQEQLSLAKVREASRKVVTVGAVVTPSNSSEEGEDNSNDDEEKKEDELSARDYSNHRSDDISLSYKEKEEYLMPPPKPLQSKRQMKEKKQNQLQSLVSNLQQQQQLTINKENEEFKDIDENNVGVLPSSSSSEELLLMLHSQKIENLKLQTQLVELQSNLLIEEEKKEMMLQQQEQESEKKAKEEEDSSGGESSSNTLWVQLMKLRSKYDEKEKEAYQLQVQLNCIQSQEETKNILHTTMNQKAHGLIMEFQNQIQDLTNELHKSRTIVQEKEKENLQLKLQLKQVASTKSKKEENSTTMNSKKWITKVKSKNDDKAAPDILGKSQKEGMEKKQEEVALVEQLQNQVQELTSSLYEALCETEGHIQKIDDLEKKNSILEETLSLLSQQQKQEVGENFNTTIDENKVTEKGKSIDDSNNDCQQLQQTLQLLPDIHLMQSKLTGKAASAASEIATKLEKQLNEQKITMKNKEAENIMLRNSLTEAEEKIKVYVHKVQILEERILLISQQQQDKNGDKVAMDERHLLSSAESKDANKRGFVFGEKVPILNHISNSTFHYHRQGDDDKNSDDSFSIQAFNKLLKVKENIVEVTKVATSTISSPSSESLSKKGLVLNRRWNYSAVEEEKKSEYKAEEKEEDEKTWYFGSIKNIYNNKLGKLYSSANHNGDSKKVNGSKKQQSMTSSRQQQRQRFTTVNKAILDMVKKAEQDSKNVATDKELALLYHSIGFVCMNDKKYDSAMKYFLRYLSIFSNLYGEEDEQFSQQETTADVYNYLGTCYSDGKGEHKIALQYWLKALEIYEKTVGEIHPSTSIIYGKIGGSYKKGGEYHLALEFYLKSLSIKKETLGVDHPGTATTLNNIALCYRDMNEKALAIQYYMECLTIEERILGKKHPSTALTYYNLGALYYEMNDYNEAQIYMKRALTTQQKVLGCNHPHTVLTQGWYDGINHVITTTKTNINITTPTKDVLHEDFEEIDIH